MDNKERTGMEKIFTFNCRGKNYLATPNRSIDGRFVRNPVTGQWRRHSIYNEIKNRRRQR